MIDLGSWAETLGLRRKKTFVERMQDAAEDVVESIADTVMPVLSKPAKMARSVRDIDLDVRVPSMPKMRTPDIHMPDIHMPKMRMPDVHMPDIDLPKVRAGELAGEAADRVRHTASATGAAAVGVAAGIGGFFGAIFSWLWWVTTFLVKTALLVGVAYAGWQWLQTRRTTQSWNTGSSTPSDTSTYTSSVYGTVTNSDAPASAGAR